MKSKIRIWLVLSFAMVALFSVLFVSCGGDDNEDENVLVGQWHECNSAGTLIDDETGYEVLHIVFRSNGTGEYWSVTKGDREHGYSFDYSCSFDDSTSGVINFKEEDRTYSYRFTLNNGILHLGEIYYKRASS